MKKLLFLAVMLLGCATSHRPGDQLRERMEALQEPDEQGDGLDIVTLIAQGKVEVQTQGSGIQKVSLKVRKLVPEALNVRIPAGTFFVSANPGSQNMVATANSMLPVTGPQWYSISPPVACANRPRHIPGTADSFKILRSPFQRDLEKLMPVLASANASYPVRQAAVWIVTDNPDYEGLGSLVDPNKLMVTHPTASYGPNGEIVDIDFHNNKLIPSRVIDAGHIVQAMQLLIKAGIDIHGRAIWTDRMEVKRWLKDAHANPSLAKWLEQQR